VYVDEGFHPSNIDIYGEDESKRWHHLNLFIHFITQQLSSATPQVSCLHKALVRLALNQLQLYNSLQSKHLCSQVTHN
jgi:hypothetical protein